MPKRDAGQMTEGLKWLVIKSENFGSYQWYLFESHSDEFILGYLFVINIKG